MFLQSRRIKVCGEAAKSLASAIGVDMVLSKPDGMVALMKAVEALLWRGLPAARPD
jgi:hypothetical protein